MNLKGNILLKRKFFALIALLFIFSCEDDIREVMLFDLGTVEISASTTSIIEGQSVDFSSVITKAQTFEWSFPGGSPSNSIEPNATITYASAGVYEAKIEVDYIDNTSETKTITITVEEDPNAPDPPVNSGCGGAYGTYNIAIATNNVAAEAGYIAVLEAAGHTVEAIAGQYENLDAAGADALNDFDLVFISRNNSSGSYGTDPAVRAAWMSVETPVVVMSPYVSRVSRQQFFPTDGGIDGGGDTLEGVIEDHPIFAGVTITNGSIGPITTSTLNTPDTGSAGNGTLIATDGTNVAIAEWDANTEFYPGSTQAVGKRMYLAATGEYTYNDVGTQIYLNVVEYMVTGTVPEPCPPLDIAFVTDDPVSDAGYITLLEEAGHTVQAEASIYNNLDAAGASALSDFDLVIISRNTNSGNFDASIADVWAQVTAPILNMSSYVARSSRLQFFNSANQDENGGTTMVAQDPAHPVFSGVNLDGGGSVDVTAVQLHVIVSNDPGNGTLIGLTGDGSNATIAEWAANTASYSGGTVFAARRMFLAGTGGGFNYNDEGSKIFINAVNYIAQ